MQEVIMEIIKTCMPIVVGALIAIIPTMLEKANERKQDKAKQQFHEKQQMYVELISLFGKVLKHQGNSDELNALRERINLISITGGIEVVKALNEYIDTWGKESVDDQNEKYRQLLIAIRYDLKIDTKANHKFPQIGLRDINIKSHTIKDNDKSMER